MPENCPCKTRSTFLPRISNRQTSTCNGSSIGHEISHTFADVILIGSDLSKLVETLRVARRCRAIIMQNFVGTLVVDSIGVGMAAFGFLNPLLAAFIHVTSELAFILNSTRLLPRTSGNWHYSRFVRGRIL
jgi:cation transport ATPase